MFARDREVKIADLERRFAHVCGHLNAGHGQLLDLVVEMLATDGWHGYGFRSPEHWVSLRTGFSPSRAKQLVHLASRAGELPVTCDALRSGRLSIDQAVVVAQHVPAHNDAEACGIAVLMAVSQLRFALGKYGFPKPEPEPAVEPPPVEPEAESPTAPSPPHPVVAPIDPQLAPGDLSFFFDEHGRFHLRLDAPMADGLLIEAALTEARDALFRAGKSDVTWMDAFNEICRRASASNEITNIGAARADRYRVHIHMDTEGAWVKGNMRVPQALLDEIMCDGIVRPVWTTGGAPVNVGRQTRTISPALRRLILHRDGHRCRTPGCGSTLGLQVHHIKWFGRDHGLTVTLNLVIGCDGCHHLYHLEKINIAGNADDPDGLVYTDEHGHNLIRHPVPIPPDGPPPAPTEPFLHPTGERFEPNWLWFRPPPQAA